MGCPLRNKKCPTPILKRIAGHASNTSTAIERASILQRGKGALVLVQGVAEPVETPAILARVPNGIYLGPNTFVSPKWILYG